MGIEITRGNVRLSAAPVSTRGSIIAAARRLLTREGAGQVSLDAVATEAGVPVETVSVHFKDKQDLLIGLAADDMSSLASAMREGERDERPAPQPRIIEHVAKPDERVMARLEKRMQMLERAFADVVERHASARQTNAEPEVKPNDLTSPEPPEGLTMTEDQNGTELPPVAVTSEAHAVEETAQGMARATEEFDLPPVVAPAAAKAPGADMPEPARGPSSRDYLAAARLAASATQSDMASRVRSQPAAVSVPKSGKSRARVLVYGCAAPLVILAASIMVLNRNTVTAEPAAPAVPVQQTASAEPAVVAPKVAQPPEAQHATAEPSANAAPAPAQPASGQAPNTPAANEPPIEVLIQSAQLGDAKAERDLGLHYLTGKGIDIHEAEAARWLMQSAYQGEPTAEYWLGTLYTGGKGVPADAFQAKHWYEAAAKKGNVKAMHSLALAQFQGQGPDKDTPSAVLWFTRAAEMGLRPSQYNLGNLYEQGNGVSRNLVEAYKWYALAAAHGDHDAAIRLTAVESQLKPEEVAQAKQAVTTFKPMSQDPSAN